MSALALTNAVVDAISSVLGVDPDHGCAFALNPGPRSFETRLKEVNERQTLAGVCVKPGVADVGTDAEKAAHAGIGVSVAEDPREGSARNYTVELTIAATNDYAAVTIAQEMLADELDLQRMSAEMPSLIYWEDRGSSPPLFDDDRVCYSSRQFAASISTTG